MLDTSTLNPKAQLLAQAMLERFADWGRWARPYGPEDDPAADPESVSFEVPSPTHHSHSLRILLRGNSVEVHYDDGSPPGAAEKLFVFETGEEGSAFAAVVAFVADVVDERVVVGRERLSRLTQLLRGRDCADLPRFFHREELSGRVRRKLTSVVSWRGTYA